MSRPSVKERATRFIEKARPSIAGQHGHDALYAVACALVISFGGRDGLSDAEAWELISLYNAQSCQPAWSDRDLARKLDQARKQADRDPSKVGELIHQDRVGYTGPAGMRVPTVRADSNARAGPEAPRPAPSARGSPPNTAAPAARTARTALFEVREFGAGGTARGARTLRTLPLHSLAYVMKGVCSNVGGSKQASEVSEPKKPAGGGSATTSAVPRSSDVEAVRLVPCDASVVPGARAVLVGDALRLYDALVRRGPMTRATLTSGLKWGDERLAASETVLVRAGWLRVEGKAS